MFGHTVSDLQSDVSVTGNKIAGTLSYVTEGALPEYWGAGNFLALKFSDADPHAESLKVGLDPSEGSGMTELDEDMNAVFKITDKDEQKLVTEVKDGPTGNVTRTEYDLSELVLEEERSKEVLMTVVVTGQRQLKGGAKAPSNAAKPKKTTKKTGGK